MPESLKKDFEVVPTVTGKIEPIVARAFRLPYE